MKIAITGNIGSGKSTFTGFAKKAGFAVLLADDVSKNILDTDDKVRELVVKEFGKDSYIKDKPNKDYLAKNIFSNPAKLQKLESILHPRVINSINKSIKELLLKEKVVFVEAALIYEADMEKMFDFVILITAKKELRLSRKISSGFSEDDFIKRELNQITEAEKMKRADFIFSNDSTIEELKMKFDLFLLTLGLNK